MSELEETILENEIIEADMKIMAIGDVANNYEIIPINAKYPKALNNFNKVVGGANSNTSLGFIGDVNSVSTILPVGETYSMATGINNSSVTIGYIISTTNYTSKGFIYSGGTFAYLPTLGGSQNPQAINDYNEIVGQNIDSTNQFKAFYFKSNQVISLGTLGGPSSSAYSINNKGQIVGTSRISPTNGISKAFIYKNGVMSELGSFGGSSSTAYDINENGWVVGVSDLPFSLGSHAFVNINNQMVDLGTLGGRTSIAASINNSNVIVGRSEVLQVQYTSGNTIPGMPMPGMGSTSSGTGTSVKTFMPTMVGFAWQNGLMINLNDRINANSGWKILQADCINDNGMIAGIGLSQNGLRQLVLLKPIY